MGPVFGVDVDGSSFVGGEFGGDVLEEGFCFGVSGLVGAVGEEVDCLGVVCDGGEFFCGEGVGHGVCLSCFCGWFRGDYVFMVAHYR